MRRILLLVMVAVTVAVILAVAGPAFATIHELSNAECSPDTTPASAQDPPGLTPGGPDKSEQLATSVLAVFDNPSDGASHNALRGPAPPLDTDFGPHPGTDNCVNLREPA